MGTGIKAFRFKHLKQADGISHAIFARSGGTSARPFDSLNVGMGVGDEMTAIVRNREKIIRAAGVNSLVFVNQVHGDGIRLLKKVKNRGASNPPELGKEIFVADAIITDMKGVGLTIQVADCQAVLLYDPGKRVIANIHSGWRGSIQNIIGKCIVRMADTFGCRPRDIFAGISPSLGPCCAEFVHYKKELPKLFWKYRTVKKDHFDFWKISTDQLLESGLKKDHIEIMGICTKCHSNDFFSYRAEKTTGRFACVIAMI